MIFFLFILIILFENMEGLLLKVNYKMETYEGNYKEKFHGEPIYAAFDVKIDRSCDQRGSVVGVPNNHMAGKNSYHVEQLLFAIYQKIPRIPGDINYFYPNLLTFRMPFCELEEINSEDLRYPRLMHLYIGNNKLKKLDGDLFKHTPSLVFLGMESNNIQTLGWFIFDNLNNLNIVYAFGPNMCIDNGGRNRNQILDFMKRILSKCNKG